MTRTRDGFEICCAWCCLLKEVNEQGLGVWPETLWGLGARLERGSERYNACSHGMCPECREKMSKGVRDV